ncbi:hypothetical protein P7C70_g5158, partial [Phenoliferia sp. Uapishka_3]
MYGELKLRWLAQNVWSLKQTFIRNRSLLKLVRRLDITAVSYRDWHMEQLHAAHSLRKLEEGYEQEKKEVLDGEMDAAWNDALDERVWEKWVEEGYAEWSYKSGAGILGAHKVLDLIEALPNFQVVGLRRFEGQVEQAQSDQGPFISTRSIGTPHYYSDDIDSEPLASFIASRSPGLRRYRGRLEDTFLQDREVLPPLTHLDIQPNANDDNSLLRNKRS